MEVLARQEGQAACTPTTLGGCCCLPEASLAPFSGGDSRGADRHNQIFSPPQPGVKSSSPPLRLAQILHRAGSTESVAYPTILAAGSLVSQCSLSTGVCGVAVTTAVVPVLSRHFWFGCQSV